MENKRHKQKKIVFTGGHAASTAFVLSQEIFSRKINWKIIWIGSKNSIEGKNSATISSVYFPKYGIQTYELLSGRIQTRWSSQTIPSILKIPISFIQAFFLLLKINPDLVLSFGGYAAFPIVFWSFILKIPVIIHEQTSVAGRANRVSSIFAKKIAISRETSKKYFPKDKLVLTGNPLPNNLIVNTQKRRLPIKPSVLITGGQSGSETINSIVEKIIVFLVKNYKIYHLTGLQQEKKFQKLKDKLPLKLKGNYYVKGIVDPYEYDKIFNQSDIIISRAGANTVSRIIYSRKPAILIPLGISYLNEQEKNAEFARQIVGSRIIKQSNLTQDKLIKELEIIKYNFQKQLSKMPKYKNPDEKASNKIIDLIKDALNE